MRLTDYFPTDRSRTYREVWGERRQRFRRGMRKAVREVRGVAELTGRLIAGDAFDGEDTPYCFDQATEKREQEVQIGFRRKGTTLYLDDGTVLRYVSASGTVHDRIYWEAFECSDKEINGTKIKTEKSTGLRGIFSLANRPFTEPRYEAVVKEFFDAKSTNHPISDGRVWVKGKWRKARRISLMTIRRAGQIADWVLRQYEQS